MGFGSSDLHVRSLTESDVVARVEREAGANDFGKKESSARQGKKKRSDDEEQLASDQVELSEEYLSEHDAEAEVPGTPDQASSTDGSASKHLDIEA